MVLLTGAASGIGLELSKKLILENVQLIALDKNQKNLEQLDDFARENGSKITIACVDLVNFEQIDNLGYQIFERFGKIDIFISMAAIVTNLTPLTHLTPKVWQKIMDVNLTANWRLIRSFDLLLKKSEKSLAIFASCEEVFPSPAFYGAYAVSKAALEALAEIYAQESKDSSLHVEFLRLKKVYSEIGKTIWPGLEEADFNPISEIAEEVLSKIRKRFS